ncbi:MAG: ParA family protein [Myxococcota bacterium]
MKRWHPRPYRVLCVSSNKGGVGKTTVAANLAVYLRALREDLPILIFGLDDQSVLDHMFSLDPSEPTETVATALRAGSFAAALRPGQYGVHHVPSDPCISTLKTELTGSLHLQEALDRTGWRGLVIIDTKSDLEILTRNAIAASDLTLVPVCDEASLQEATKVFELLEGWSLPGERARVLLSMLDRRVRYGPGGERNLWELLVSELEERGHPRFEAHLSHSPKVQSLGTNPEGRALSILHGAPRSRVHEQMGRLAQEVLDALGRPDEPRRQATRPRPTPPANPAKRFLLRSARPRPWSHATAEDEESLDRLLVDLHAARG